MTRFEAYYSLKPTPAFFQIPRQNRLYVQGWEFINWFKYPDVYCRSGAVMSLAYDGDAPVAVSVITVESVYEHDNKPMIGFFTRKAYRRLGLSKILGRLTYETYLEQFPSFGENVIADDGQGMINWQTAYHICKSLSIPAEVAR